MVTLNNQTSIDETMISPTAGVNVVLVDSQDPTKFFNAIVSGMVASVRNADTGVFTGIILEGVNELGERRSLTITIQNIEDMEYGIYDTLLFTKNLSEQVNVDVVEATDTNIIVDDRSVRVFDAGNVVAGKLISYKLPDGREFRGIITQVPTTGEARLIVNTNVGQQTLTLQQATHPNFEGTIHEIIF